MATLTETRDIAQPAQARALTSSAPQVLNRQRSDRQGGHMGIKEESLARALGWFSIGLGIAEIIAPRTVAKLVGTDNHKPLVRGYGLREIASGVGILTQPRAAPWVWSRVGGDMLDLASLAAALKSRRNERGKTMGAIAAVAGVTALDVLCAQQLSAGTGGASGRAPIRAEASLIINRSPEECYRFWRNFENLPRFMSYLEAVWSSGDRRSHWIARGPGNTKIQWDAEIVNDVPNQRISWRSLPGSDIENSGSVEFEPAPGGRGTLVRVQMDFGQPSQALGMLLTKLVGRHPEHIVMKDLRRFKQVLEVGEVITTEGQPAGRTSSTTWLDTIAR
jgi:uncharacterized membrane protein